MSETPSSTSCSTFPPFPSQIIHGLAKEFVDLYSSISETPVAFLWLAFVTYFGNLISANVRLNSTASEPRFFGVAIGRSARTRKSSGQNNAKSIFERVQERLNKTTPQTIIQGFGSSEGVMETLKRSGNGPKRAILHLDEMNQLAAKTSVPGSAGTAPLHKLWQDHDYHHPKAKGGGYEVKDTYLSLIGASTLEDFQNSWDANHADAGFFSRLFVVVADAVKGIARPIDPNPEALDHLVEGIRSVVEELNKRTDPPDKPFSRGRFSAPIPEKRPISEQRVFTLTPEAERLWESFYMENVFSNSDDVEWNRIDAYGERFMALQAVLRNEQEVTKENVQEVIELMQYEVATRRIVRPIIAENPTAKLEEKVRRNLPEGVSMTKRNLSRKISANRWGLSLYDVVLGNLERAGEIEKRPIEGKKSSFLITRIPQDVE